MAESARDGRAEVPVPVAQPGRGTTNDPLSVSWDQLAVSSRVSSEVRDRLIEDLRRALAVEPEAGESGAVQWYVSDLAVDCDTDTLLAVLARGLLAAGWRLPLPDTLSPWDAYREAYDAFRRDTPSWRAHFTAHHMHALEAALRVYDPCAEHGDLLRRFVAASLEFDYTAEGDSGGDYDDDAAEREAAIANVVEMHRLLNVRAERLAEAHEKLRALSSPLPDSETEPDAMQWGYREHVGEDVDPVREEYARFRAQDEHLKLVQREVRFGPWIEVTSG